MQLKTVAVAVALVTASPPGPALSAAPDTIAVHRGSIVETTPARGATGVADGTVAVVRGPPGVGSTGGGGQSGQARRAAPVRILAGHEVWFVDPERDRLIACRMGNTARVGRLAIRCTARRLPKLAAWR